MVKLTNNQKEKLNDLRAYYCRVLAEDPIDGSTFDCTILDLLTDSIVENEFNQIHSFRKNQIKDVKNKNKKYIVGQAEITAYDNETGEELWKSKSTLGK